MTCLEENPWWCVSYLLFKGKQLISSIVQLIILFYFCCHVLIVPNVSLLIKVLMLCLRPIFLKKFFWKSTRNLY